MRLWAAAALVTLAHAAHAAPVNIRALAPEESKLEFHVAGKVHGASGATQHLEGLVREENGLEQVEVRADSASFTTGDTTRDVDLKGTIDVARYPTVTFKGVIRNAHEPASFPARIATVITGELEFHGRSRPVRAPVTISFSPSGEARVTTDFDINLDSFGIKRPAILFGHVSNRCHIHADLLFVR